MDLTSLVVVNVNTMPSLKSMCELVFHDNPCYLRIISS